MRGISYLVQDDDDDAQFLFFLLNYNLVVIYAQPRRFLSTLMERIIALCANLICAWTVSPLKQSLKY